MFLITQCIRSGRVEKIVSRNKTTQQSMEPVFSVRALFNDEALYQRFNEVLYGAYLPSNGQGPNGGKQCFSRQQQNQTPLSAQSAESSLLG